MEVNSCKSILDNPDGVAFLPTQLLIDITNKEYDAVKQLKDSDLLNNDKLLNTENENDSMIEALKRIGEHDVNVESDSDYMERLADETYTVSEEKKAARARIQREATMKNGTLNPEILKLLYVSEPLDDVVMPLCQHENISIESLKNGKVKAVNKSAAEELLTNYGIHIRLKRFTEEDENDSLIPADFKTG
jgi:ribonuclease HI